MDRIDNTLGYTQENCRMVCWGYNLTKNNYTDRDVHAFAISTTLQFVHKNMQKELLKLLPDHCLEYFPSGNKHAKVIKEIQVGG